MTKAPDQCELCRRTPVLTTVHHLTPRKEEITVIRQCTTIPQMTKKELSSARCAAM